MKTISIKSSDVLAIAAFSFGVLSCTIFDSVFEILFGIAAVLCGLCLYMTDSVMIEIKKPTTRESLQTKK